MPNIAAAFREEIVRLARKELRAAVGPLRKRVAELTRSHAALRKTVPALEREVTRLSNEAEARQIQSIRAGAKELKGIRIGPRSIGAQRKRLKLTREEFGKLAGVSANTIYLWETGQVSPREKSRGVLVGLRKLRAREAKKLLAAAGPEEKRSKTRGKRRLGRRGKRR
ncbi:MAG: helix-turn-helix domain-containing protein [Planctomycetota bacterium]|nr:helix-turn-helix domain-containing protein [Planctomycetota bacterium]